MRAEDISSIIASEIARDPNFYNSLCMDLDVCLVRPELREFSDSCNDNEPISLWLVLKERPNEESGYLVIYDEDCNMFGLAVSGEPRPVLISYCESFTQTLAGM
jgi:hypothetical protein